MCQNKSPLAICFFLGTDFTDFTEKGIKKIREIRVIRA